MSNRLFLITTGSVVAGTTTLTQNVGYRWKQKNVKKIYLFERVSYTAAERVIKEIHDASGPIELYINSNGGDLAPGVAVIDAINDCPHKVHTIITGKACSAAAIISICGKQRSMTRNSCVMFHDPYYPDDDNDEDEDENSRKFWTYLMPFNLFKRLFFGKHHTNRISTPKYEDINIKRGIKLAREIVCSHTKLTDKEYTDLQDLEMYADDAMKYGFVDKIM
jgi:ATP-dependent protease ClpP protease subunit